MKTAIVVDDDPITRLDLSQMLEELDFNVVGCVDDGFEAVELCKRMNPNLVLMDINMPVFDGLSATEQIINNSLAGDVIIITGYGDGQTVERSMQAGVSGYLVKPVIKRQLMSSIALALANRKRTDQLIERAIDAEQKLSDIKVIERAKGQLAMSNGITEQAAYKQLQKIAMDKRSSIVTIARHVLETTSERETINKAKQMMVTKLNISEEEAYKRLVSNAKKQSKSLAVMSREILSNGGQI